MLSDNLLLRVYTEKAESFLNKIQNANVVKHGPTVGDLREEVIIESLIKLVPASYELGSGFVIDANGSVTPQIDILVYQKSTLSPLLLTDRAVLLPIELFRFGIEVKSTITRKSLEQVKCQAKSLASLYNSAFITNNETFKFQKGLPPFILVAVSSDLSKKTLEEELNIIDGLIGIIVFDKCILYKGAGSYEGTSDIDRVIRFWSYMFNHCLELSQYVNISPKIEKEIIADIRSRHPELDPETIIEKIKTPSIMPYLYPT